MPRCYILLLCTHKYSKFTGTWAIIKRHFCEFYFINLTQRITRKFGINSPFTWHYIGSHSFFAPLFKSYKIYAHFRVRQDKDSCYLWSTDNQPRLSVWWINLIVIKSMCETFWPQVTSGIPNTVQSAISGWPRRCVSISSADILNPPDLIMSADNRPRILK
jgi:hypothetical protein